MGTVHFIAAQKLLIGMVGGISTGAVAGEESDNFLGCSGRVYGIPYSLAYLYFSKKSQ
jgi:hypothetical protein